MAKNWYALHVLSGHENKVKNYIETEAPLSVMADQIERVVVPTEETIQMKDGKKKSTTRKFLPSYVLIEMELNKDTQFFVNSVSSVTGFVGPAHKPVPLKMSEVERILVQIDSSKTREVPEMKFNIGDKVKVIDGPFNDFTGSVEELNPFKSKVKVTVSIFGRPTPVELDILQIEKTKSEK